jgi:hypothetical protein
MDPVRMTSAAEEQQRQAEIAERRKERMQARAKAQRLAARKQKQEDLWARERRCGQKLLAEVALVKK